MVEITRILLDAGAEKTEKMKELVTEIGKQFEYVRPNFNPEYVEQTSNALHQLYAIFEVSPVAQRVLHDGISPIAVKAETWKKQHEELWELLVSAKGPAQTIQGEVVRISGRIVVELKDNGGINWDADFGMMVDSFLEFVQQGQQLSTEEINELTKIVSEIKRKRDNSVYRFAEFGTKWIIQNPLPISLPPISYDR